MSIVPRNDGLILYLESLSQNSWKAGAIPINTKLAGLPPNASISVAANLYLIALLQQSDRVEWGLTCTHEHLSQSR